MSEVESFQLDDGERYATGLVLPNADEKLLMADMAEYPESMYLDKSDIQKALADNYYLKSRDELRGWMINQSSLGKCNASAVQGAVDQVRMHQGMPHVPLSDCWLYSRINGGRDRGSALINGFRETQRHGIAPRVIQVAGREVTLPHNFYNRRQVKSAWLEVADNEAKRFLGFEWYRAPTDYNKYKVAIASALARRQPVVFAWHVGSNSSRLRNGYVQIGRGVGNHANVFHSAKWVGGDDLVHPDNRNSWGPSKDAMYGPRNNGWGDGGFALFTMSQAFSCVRHHYTYICTSMRADPNDNFISPA